MNLSAAEARAAAAHEPHVVQFYESDAQLAASVAGFFAPGFAAGDPLLLVATAEHQGVFLAALAREGLDVMQATASGQLTVLDAEQTLATFMVGDLPDAPLFDRHVGSLIRKLEAGGARPLHVFGEMVDVLWRTGRPVAALELEELWNGLQRKHSFSLFCAYAIGGFVKSPDGMAAVCATHSHEVPREMTLELKQRHQVEHMLRAALKRQQMTEWALRASERQLRLITDALPALVSYFDREHRYRFANESYREWFGLEPGSIIGRHVRDVVGELAYPVISAKLDEVLTGKTVSFEQFIRYARGPARHVEITFAPHRDESGEVVGVISLVSDVSEKVRLQQAGVSAEQKTERLLKITAALADAITAEQVYEALVDQLASALEASSAALWVLEDDGRTVRLVRSTGYGAAAKKAFDGASVDAPARFPVLDAFRDGEPIWLMTQAELVARYPHLAAAVTKGRQYQVTAIPLVVRGKTLGVIGMTFEGGPEIGAAERPFLMLVARYSGQALERLRLLEAEKRSRVHAELLFQLAQSVLHSQRIEDMFSATLDAIAVGLGAQRAAILTYDAKGVMRFRAHRGLSDAYRKAVEGHSPWPRDAQSPQVVWVEDAMEDPSLSGYRALFAAEGIGALGFIPLVASGRLLGKFMVYYERPHCLRPAERELASSIAHHIAAATERFEAVAGLQQTVRFNEMFTAMLGHDLRNPLGAIMTAAQLLAKRNDNEKLIKPLGRIENSGRRMARMIDQLLDFTRVRVGAGIPLVRENIDLKPVIDLVLEELDSKAPDVKLYLEVTGDTRGTFDADRLAQVFSNLVGNAVEHGQRPGAVTVRVDGTSAGLVRATVHNAGGVPVDRLPMLFEPMSGTDRRGERSQGLGLGLFISQQIARAHGGTIGVESGELTGTTFEVTLPRAPS